MKNAHEVTPSVQLLTWTGSIEPVYVAARTCQSSLGMEGITKELKTMYEAEASRAKSPICDIEFQRTMSRWLLDKCFTRGHFTLFEHIDFHFVVSGVSRVFTHQQVRHRMASYNQQSQRSVAKEGFGYVIPTYIRDNAELTELYKKSMDLYNDQYVKMREAVKAVYGEKHPAYLEETRYLLPEGTETFIVIKMNGHAIMTTSRQRMCSEAQPEIRAVWNQIYTLVQECCPLLAVYMGQSCHYGECGNKCTNSTVSKMTKIDQKMLLDAIFNSQVAGVL